VTIWETEKGSLFEVSIIICLMRETREKTVPRMTDEEAEALDEMVTQYPPKVSGNGKSGLFMKHKGNIVILDDVSAAWLRVRSESTHKTPSELISEMIREKISAAI
jgi:hypothetical protein